MSAPGSLDPVLAVLDFLHDYRRSWRCWLIGGPAAVDDASIGPGETAYAVRLEADFQYEREEGETHTTLGWLARFVRWHDRPEPRSPAEGRFVNDRQRFALKGSGAALFCSACRGSGRVPCTHCRGTGGTPGEERSLGFPVVDPCPACGGSGDVRCGCAGTFAGWRLVWYEVSRFVYRHKRLIRTFASPGSAGSGIERLLRRTVRTTDHGIRVQAGRGADLLARIRAHGVPDPVALQSMARRLEDEWATATRGGWRLIHQDLRARVAHSVSATVRFGRYRLQLLGTGTGDHLDWVAPTVPRAERSWIPGAILFSTGYAVYHVWRGIARGRHTPAETPEMFAFWFTGGLVIYAILHAGFRAELSAMVRRWLSGERRPPKGPGRLHHILHSRRARPVPTIAVVGPDARASGMLYSLFAHLAAHAQLGDAARGGMLLDEGYEDLPARLAPNAPAPAASSTHRLQFGPGVRGGERVRLVHVVVPADGRTDPLCRRLLERCEQVWWVLPAGAAADAAEALRELPLSGERVPVRLVLDTSAGGATAAPAGGCWRVDLAALRDRYLAGAVGAEEAAAFVECLSGDPAGPAPAEALPGLPGRLGTTDGPPHERRNARRA